MKVFVFFIQLGSYFKMMTLLLMISNMEMCCKQQAVMKSHHNEIIKQAELVGCKGDLNLLF